MRNTIRLLGALAVLAGGCTDTEPMAERATEYNTCVDVLVSDVADHYAAVSGEDHMQAIQMLEQFHYLRLTVDLDDLDYWAGQMGECHDDRNVPYEVGNLIDHRTEARRQLALHRLAEALAEAPEDAAREEQRYQLVMMTQLGELRSHQADIEAVADRYICPLPE